MELKLIPAEGAGSLRVRGTPLNRFPEIQLGYLLVSPNLWNVSEASDGEVLMTYEPEPGWVSVEVNFRKLEIHRPVTVGGYAEVIYGTKPWGSVSRQVQELRFPMLASEASRIYLTAGYRVDSSSEGAAFDVSYDFWLTRSREPGSGLSLGDVEIMMWFHRGGSLRPTGEAVGSADLELIINDKARTSRAELWAASPSEDRPQYIVTLLADQGPKAVVGLNMNQVLSTAEEIFQKRYGLPNGYITGRYLSGIELGLEYGGANPRISMAFTRLSIGLS